MHLVLLGPPGCGKGTQAEYLHQRLGLVHLSSGDLFRDHLKRQTALGIRARDHMARGELVPDDLTIRMVGERLLHADVGGGALFDGFPRNVAQAEALDVMLQDLSTPLTAVVYMDVPDQVLLGRIAGRLICRECEATFHRETNPFVRCPQDRCTGEFLYRREDDREEVVRLRLATYHRKTEPLIEFYESRALLVRVAASGAVHETSIALSDALERFGVATSST